MAKPKMIGCIGHLSISPAKFGRKAFSFDGTTKGLIVAAQTVGAKAGDVIEANYGGGMRPYKLEATPHDMRAGGLWIA